MGPTPLHGLRVAVFASFRCATHVAWVLGSRGAVVDRVSSSTRAIDALLQGQAQVVVTDCIVPGVVLVLQARHLLVGRPGPSFGDEFVQFMEAPVDPTALVAAVARVARRLGLGPAISRGSDNGTEAA